MDFSKFGEYGIAGLAVGFIAFCCWRLLKHTLDSREADLSAHRVELMSERADSKEERLAFLASLESMQALAERRHNESMAAHDQTQAEVRSVRDAIRDLEHPGPRRARPKNDNATGIND